MRKHLALRPLLFAGAAALALAACGQKTEKPAEPAASIEAAPAADEDGAANAGDVVDYAAVADAAIANPARSAEDRAKDADRKAKESLTFMEIAPGMTVFDMEAGAGYYTELYSHAVGPDGAVVMQNPERFKSFLGDSVAVRLAGGRLANVRESYSNFDALDAPDGSVDVITWVWGPHEIYFHPDGASFGDATKTYAEIFRVLKPGGTYIVIDHSAVDGAPETTGNDLHRIDKVIVMQMADQAGFTLVSEADFLANPEDPRTVGVFDPSIRGHTDQFVLRFRKPE
ncbi:MAG: class I SAM-dependent methyltransferase [Parvularculaceae bacterium]